MSTSARGASRVGAVQTTLFKHGYRTARVSASGQRKGKRRDEHGIAGDIIALCTRDGLPHLLVEVGGVGKRLGVSFRELRGSLFPGFSPLVVRFVNRKRIYYIDEDFSFADFDEAITSLRAI